jgi:hypothetical protein
MRSIRPLLFAVTILAAGLAASQAFAWGATGHRLIGRVAMETLPADTPAFLRAPATVAAIGELAREPDRSRGAGQPHDADLDPGHFIDLTDDGATLGGSPISAMPIDRDDYDVTLHAAGANMQKGGYLYYNLLDGYQQLVEDFAYWRLENVAVSQWTDPAQKAWLKHDIELRKALIIRDLGWWAHFVGDASQPLHVSIHYNGWGNYPNPNHYTEDRIHGPFEGPFVRQTVTEAAVRAALPPLAVCPNVVQSCISSYLAKTLTGVDPLYRLWGEGAFQAKSPRAVAFTTARVADGAAALRDLVTKAWAASEDSAIGYPAISVRAVERGVPVPFSFLYGDD